MSHLPASWHSFMVITEEKRKVKTYNFFPSFACIIFSNIPLAKASHMFEPQVTCSVWQKLKEKNQIKYKGRRKKKKIIKRRAEHNESEYGKTIAKTRSLLNTDAKFSVKY